jgi:histidinol-phosphate aminotransferase
VEALRRSFPGLVVIDEAYIDFSSEPGWLGELHSWPRLIITQTLSKAFGLAGIRLGICYASTAIIAVLNKIKPPYNINELTQRQAFKSLCDTESVASAVSTIRKERKKLEERFRDIRCIEKIFPSDANFILARMDDADLRYRQLLQKGIVVRNRSGQPLCKNTLRFTIGTPDENIKLIAALKSL